MSHLKLVTDRGKALSPRPGQPSPRPEREAPRRPPAGQGAGRVEVVPFGLAEVDGHLPRGGLARKALHEFMPAGYADRAAAFGFMAGLMARFQKQSTGPLLVCELVPKVGERTALYGPGLMALGLDPARLIYLRLGGEKDFLWALEEGLSCEGLCGVAGLAAPGQSQGERIYGFTESKRLSLRARERGRPLFLLRPHGAGGASAAASRWRISARPSLPEAHPGHYLPGLGAARWRLELLRAPGASPANWEIGWNNETFHFHMAAGLGDRSLSPQDGGGDVHTLGIGRP